MSQEKKFYVYVHRYATGPKVGQVFYVGKGSGDRWMYGGSGRNTHWRRIVNKYDFIPETVLSNLSEVCAFSFERALIPFYGKENLCNMTDGGEGTSGIKQSLETCKLISKRAKGRLSDPKMHWHTEEIISTWWNSDGSIIKGSHLDVNKKTGLDLGCLKRVQSGTFFSYKGWKVAGVRNYQGKGGVNNNTSNRKVFICSKYGFPNFIGCKSDFCNFYSYDPNNAYAVFSGKCKTMDGWTVHEL